MPAKFIITKGRTGMFGFTLEAGNGSTVFKSPSYETRRAALTALRYVQRNGDTEAVDDRTVDAPMPSRAKAPARKTPVARTVAKKRPTRRTAVRKTASAKAATAKAPPRKAGTRKSAAKPAVTRKGVSRTGRSVKRTPARSRA